jgi:hypothetical protein
MVIIVKAEPGLHFPVSLIRYYPTFLGESGLNTRFFIINSRGQPFGTPIVMMDSREL